MTRTIHDPFLNKTVEISNKLTDRLRGKYACGPTMSNGEPEFGWRQHEAPPIQKEAADLIEQMLAALKKVVEVADRATVEFDMARAAIAKAEGRS